MFFLCSMLGACSRLERIEVHIGISDYFMDVEDDASKREYKDIIKKLTVSETCLTCHIINSRNCLKCMLYCVDVGNPVILSA